MNSLIKLKLLDKIADEERKSFRSLSNIDVNTIDSLANLGAVISFIKEKRFTSDIKQNIKEINNVTINFTIFNHLN